MGFFLCCVESKRITQNYDKAEGNRRRRGRNKGIWKKKYLVDGIEKED